MDRTTAPGNISGMYTEGDPGTATPATEISADALNAFQEEILAVIEDAGLTPDDGDLTQLLQAIDAKVAAAGAPIGTVRMWAGNTAAIPAGHLLCDGSAISRATYSDLFTLVGTTFGSGDTVTTFNLPDLRNKFVMGAASDGAVGAQAGANSVTATMQTGGSHNHGGTSGSHALTTAEMPAHTHAYDGLIATAGHETGSGSVEARGQVTNQPTGSTGGGSGHTHTISTQAAHSHTMDAQDNRPANVGLLYIIRSN